MTYSTTLSVFSDDVFSDAELRTLAEFLGGYSGLTRDAYALDLRQFAQWCHDRRIGLFAVARARSPACTVTWSKKDSSAAHQRFMFVGRAWTMNPTQPVLTATRSARCSWRPGWPEHAIMP